MNECKCCGTCRYIKSVRVGRTQNRFGYHMEYECQNEESEGYGLETAYDECCEEWEGK